LLLLALELPTVRARSVLMRSSARGEVFRARHRAAAEPLGARTGGELARDLVHGAKRRRHGRADGEAQEEPSTSAAPARRGGARGWARNHAATSAWGGEADHGGAPGAGSRAAGMDEGEATPAGALDARDSREGESTRASGGAARRQNGGRIELRIADRGGGPGEEPQGGAGAIRGDPRSDPDRDDLSAAGRRGRVDRAVESGAAAASARTVSLAASTREEARARDELASRRSFRLFAMVRSTAIIAASPTAQTTAR